MSNTTILRNFTFASLITFAFLLAGCSTAFAGVCTTVNTLPYWDGNITSGWLGQAQTFVAPSASCNVLLDYEFNMAARSSAGSLQLNIFQWGGSGPIGSAVFSITLPWGTTAATY